MRENSNSLARNYSTSSFSFDKTFFEKSMLLNIKSFVQTKTIMFVGQTNMFVDQTNIFVGQFPKKLVTYL